MKVLLLKGKHLSSLPLHLQKHKKYGLKNSIPSIWQGSWILSSLLFSLYQNEGGGVLVKINIQLVEISPHKCIF